MEKIKILVENIITQMGLTGESVPIVRHLFLVVVAVLLAWLSDCLCRRLLVPLVLRITKKTEAVWDDVLFNKQVLVSACHIIPAIVIWQLLPLVFYEFPLVRELLIRATAIYITVMSVRTSIVLINSFRELDSEKRSSTQQYFYTFIGVLKILMIFIATVVIVAILLNKNPMTLFAGLGATSAILMLVFKDTIEGLVAGVRLTSNDMLHKGDWITVPGTEINGIVEEMTLSTIKVRNFDNTMMTVSPLTLVNGIFQNWKSMQAGGGRRVKRVVYYDFRSVRFVDEKKTLTNMGQFRQAMEKYLSSRKDVNAQMAIVVKEVEATQNGLPIEFIFFIRNDESIHYEHTLADIMEYIYAVSTDYGLTIYQQYPEQ